MAFDQHIAGGVSSKSLRKQLSMVKNDEFFMRSSAKDQISKQIKVTPLVEREEIAFELHEGVLRRSYEPQQSSPK